MVHHISGVILAGGASQRFNGIHSALKESDKDALIVVAGDMPLLDTDIIVRQIAFYNSDKCDVLIPQIEQYIEPLHGIYKKTLIPVLEEYLGKRSDYAIREFFKKACVHYIQIEGSEKSRRAFTNINSPYDISIVNKLLGID